MPSRLTAGTLVLRAWREEADVRVAVRLIGDERTSRDDVEYIADAELVVAAVRRWLHSFDLGDGAVTMR